ncbi:hypothetical protein B0T16DRAFT_159102 [Cercophora newfieldiana]|uniref:Uncharacterized protein n=1 Tax=Cercophora newfieldiana TaxID=92897 RepID=A0AA39Y5C4_9PEZI|nr:hypothetical protein B0T16DRAFT_159102 [Cercophora newfieldiana]
MQDARRCDDLTATTSSAIPTFENSTGTHPLHATATIATPIPTASTDASYTVPATSAGGISSPYTPRPDWGSSAREEQGRLARVGDDGGHLSGAETWTQPHSYPHPSGSAGELTAAKPNSRPKGSHLVGSMVVFFDQGKHLAALLHSNLVSSRLLFNSCGTSYIAGPFGGAKLHIIVGPKAALYPPGNHQFEVSASDIIAKIDEASRAHRFRLGSVHHAYVLETRRVCYEVYWEIPDGAATAFGKTFDAPPQAMVRDLVLECSYSLEKTTN